MTHLTVAGKTYALNEHGFLEEASLWNEQVAEALAATQSISLTAAHWEIIYFLRAFHHEFHTIPIMRLLCKAIKKELGDEKGSSIYLNNLFQGVFLKQACRIAGLPKPKHCL